MSEEGGMSKGGKERNKWGMCKGEGGREEGVVENNEWKFRILKTYISSPIRPAGGYFLLNMKQGRNKKIENTRGEISENLALANKHSIYLHNSKPILLSNLHNSRYTFTKSTQL